MADAVVVVDTRAAERDRVDLLAERLADDAGAGQEHRGVLGHDDQVGKRRRVRATAGRRSRNHRDLRHHPGQADRVAEDPSVSGQRGLPFLHPRAAGLDERDDRDPGALGRLEHANDRVGVTLAERPAEVASHPGRSRRSAAHRRTRWRPGRRRRRPRGPPAAAGRRASAAPGRCLGRTAPRAARADAAGAPVRGGSWRS